MINFDLLTNAGKLKRPISPDEIAALEPHQLAALTAADNAAEALDVLTAKLATAQAETKVLAFAHDAARLALLHVQPHKSVPELVLAEQRRSSLPARERERLARIPIDPAIALAADKAAVAELAFEQGKQNLRQIQSEIEKSKWAISDAVVTFQKQFVPQTPGELIKQYLAREQARRIANGGDAPRPQEAEPMTPLDAHMRSSKGPLGVRDPRQSARGAYPASMRGQMAPGWVAPPAALAPWATRPKGPRQ